MLFWFLFGPRDSDIQAWNDTRPALCAGVAVMPDPAVDKLLDNDITGDACLGVGEGEDESDCGERHGLFDGADRTLVLFFGGDHEFRDSYIHLIQELGMDPIEFWGDP